jgi:hypothetical protein
VRVFILHAEGGAGKTRVVAQWLTQMRDDGWRGAQRVFVHSFYSQGSDERRNASSELFFEQALDHFCHTGPRIIDPTEQGRTLARLLIEQHGLLVLDGIEPLQHPPSFDQGRLKDPAIRSLLLSLAAGRMGNPSGGGLCVITSRQSVQELKDKVGRTVMQQPLDQLDVAAGAELLRQLEVRGPERELREAVEDAHGHAYSLMLLGTYLRDATDDHEIRRRREIPLLEEDAEHRYHARHLFGAYVRHLGENSPAVAVLRLLGFFDRPAEERLMGVLREAANPELNALTASLRALSDADWRRVLRRLTDLRLIDIAASPSPPIDSHPLLRDYFAEQLRARFPEAWQAGHRRLFEHLCKTTEDLPDTLAGLQPLYQAVAHGCLARLHQQACDVYFARILRGTENEGFYSVKKLGAITADLGVVACFFEAQWATLAPNLTPAGQAWLLNLAANRLRALGRLMEAVEPMRAGLERCVKDQAWKRAAINAGNVSELELTRGDLSNAVDAARLSVTYADRSGDAFQQMACRNTLADALHQAGRLTEAQSLFEDAEDRQAAREPKYPLLLSLGSFRYCELLLASAERAAWQRCLRVPLTTCTAACDTVSDRADGAQRAWKEIFPGEPSLLDRALDSLTLTRAMLYKADSASSIPRSAVDHIIAAVDGFRAAGRADYLPRGLLTRAWLQCLSGNEQGCRVDLAEAWEIAERGPMPLFQADILLYRARLFHDRGALAEARRLIEKHGYHRRDEELADAEAAAKRWGERATESQTPTTVDKDPVVMPPTRRFRIALSFPGEHRPFVEQVAEHLSAAVGREKVLYDKYYEAEFARADLDTYLQKLYHDESDLIAVFLSADYERKEWCGLEWRALRDLIKRRQTASVMPLRFDNTEIPGLFSTDGYIWIGDRSPADIAQRILERWRFNAGQPPTAPPSVALPGSPLATRAPSPAVALWRKKLDFLLSEEAKAFDPAAKFKIQQDIEEARQKIRELEGQS